MKNAGQVLCIGNAIVDVLTKVDDEFLARFAMDKGAMILVDEATSESIYSAMPPATERSGGSAANTAAGIASLGGSSAYIGKVKDDQLGHFFRHDLTAQGVSFETAPQTAGEATASCLILITPDAQRTMNTYLGACGALTPADVSEAEIAAADICYVEGYLWDRDDAKAAVLKAMQLAAKNDTRVALTLSDSFCVDRFREEFLDLVENHVDILFANEDELKSLYEVDDFDSGLQALRPHVKIAALTRSEKGSVILSGDEVHVIDAKPVEVVDTTGAGDLYAAGFLYGITNGYGLADAGHIGSACAAEIISHVGARPERDLAGIRDALF
ncbi:MAG: adenosine kinase [Gammaproteobacteria bacterium]|nr:adenosine kinase [Gammaproteobacteria bacterium]